LAWTSHPGTIVIAAAAASDRSNFMTMDEQ
jgi:hypothetical protein